MGATFLFMKICNVEIQKENIEDHLSWFREIFIIKMAILWGQTG